MFVGVTVQVHTAVFDVVLQDGVKTTDTAVPTPLNAAESPVIVIFPSAEITAVAILGPEPGATIPEPAPVTLFKFCAASVMAVRAALAANSNSDTLARAV